MNEEVTGQSLYEVFLGAMSEQGIECEPWDSIDETDQYAWEVLAAHVRVNS